MSPYYYILLSLQFNEFNARSLDNRFNVFRGLSKDVTFLSIVAISAVVQAILVQKGAGFVKSTGLTGQHWFYSLLIASVTLPLGVAMRWIPVADRQADSAHHYLEAWEARQAEAASVAGLPAAVQAQQQSQSQSQAQAQLSRAREVRVAVAASAPMSTQPQRAPGLSALASSAVAPAADGDAARFVAAGNPLMTHAGAAAVAAAAVTAAATATHVSVLHALPNSSSSDSSMGASGEVHSHRASLLATAY